MLGQWDRPLIWPLECLRLVTSAFAEEFGSLTGHEKAAFRRLVGFEREGVQDVWVCACFSIMAFSSERRRVL